MPISAPVDPTVFKPLIKGAPAALNPFLIAKLMETQSHIHHNECVEVVSMAQAIGNRNREEACPDPGSVST